MKEEIRKTINYLEEIIKDNRMHKLVEHGHPLDFHKYAVNEPWYAEANMVEVLIGPSHNLYIAVGFERYVPTAWGRRTVFNKRHELEIKWTPEGELNLRFHSKLQEKTIEMTDRDLENNPTLAFDLEIIGLSLYKWFVEEKRWADGERPFPYVLDDIMYDFESYAQRRWSNEISA